MIIPYGTTRLPERAIRATDAGYVCSVPHVVIDRRVKAPVRLNDSRFDFRDSLPLQELADPTDQVAFLRADLVARCDLWSAAQRRFVDRYFEYVASRIDAHRDRLSAAIAPFGELYRVRDWTFSAWRPFPRAHLHAPDGSGEAPYRRDAMVPVDFAFWDGTRAVAVELTGTTSKTLRRRRQLGRLRDTGTLLIEVPVAALERSPDQIFGTRFPDAFAQFWEGQRFPSGAFRPDGLRVGPLQPVRARTPGYTGRR